MERECGTADFTPGNVVVGIGIVIWSSLFLLQRSFMYHCTLSIKTFFSCHGRDMVKIMMKVGQLIPQYRGLLNQRPAPVQEHIQSALLENDGSAFGMHHVQTSRFSFSLHVLNTFPS